jgi:RIO-like serine/threonine protein kinase
LNDRFTKIQGGKCTLYIHKDFRSNNFEQALLSGEEKLRERYRLTTIQSSKFTRVYKLTVGFGNGDRVIYYKQYLCRSLWDFIKRFVRANRAERAFKATEMLRESGFDVPSIIALGKFKCGFCRTADFFVTLEIENAGQICRVSSDGGLGIRDKRELILAFGQTVGRMHAMGIFHGDLRLGNVLAKKEKDRWRFFFIDNERTRKFRHLPCRLRLKNLVQMNMFRDENITDTDRMRFFREYRAQNKEFKVEQAALIKQVLEKTSRRLKKKDQRR